MSWFSKTFKRIGNSLKKRAGTIGTVVGSAVGSVVAPGAGTALGAQIGGMIGGAVQGGMGESMPEVSTPSPIIQELPVTVNQLPPIVTRSGGFTGMGFGGSYENQVNGQGNNVSVAQYRSSGNSSAMLIALGLGGLVLLSD